jgi:Tfp pilus assembly protein PilN
VIEINLVPGSSGKASRRGLPKLGGGGFKLPKGDRTVSIMLGLGVAAIGLIAWLHVSTSARLENLTADHEAAVRDSVRYAQLRAQGDSLRDQVAMIGQKLEVIQEIDGGRYIWPHVLDEISRALPPYVWLTNVSDAYSETGYPRVALQGRAGNLYALGRYMRELESSPFLTSVRLISSAQVRVEERTVYTYALEVGYEEPPPDVVETVPLFAAMEQED